MRRQCGWRLANIDFTFRCYRQLIKSSSIHVWYMNKYGFNSAVKFTSHKLLKDLAGPRLSVCSGTSVPPWWMNWYTINKNGLARAKRQSLACASTHRHVSPNSRLVASPPSASTLRSKSSSFPVRSDVIILVTSTPVVLETERCKEILNGFRWRQAGDVIISAGTPSPMLMARAMILSSPRAAAVVG